MKLILAIALVIGALVVVPAAAQTGPIVTITIDDSTADQMLGARILTRYGMRATFYVISGAIGTPGYLTRTELDELRAAGHEIGGHTVSHPDLTTVPLDEARRQICTDRVTLTDWGFPVTSFAYPFTAHNADLERVAHDCGYTSARSLGDLRSRHDCSGCDPAETIPPQNPYNVRAPDRIDKHWTLADLQWIVQNTTNGWVPLVLHQICDGCAELSLSPVIFEQFVAWLKDRGTTVRTVHEVMGGAPRPVVHAPLPHTGLVNAGLEDGPQTSDGLPTCWSTAGWGDNRTTRTRTNDAHTGRWAQRIDMLSYRGGDTKILPAFDLGTCAPSAAAGRAYRVRAWFKATGFSQFALYHRTATGSWAYWTSGPLINPSDHWAEASWMTPPLPQGSTAMSFGLALVSVGSLTTDDYRWALTGAGPRAKAS